MARERKTKISHRDRIYSDFLTRIQCGEISREDRLIDTAIAGELGVSRMPVRDALMRLAHEGYLELTTRGFMLPTLSRQDVLDIFEIRRLLEPRAVAWAAQSLDDATLAVMSEAVENAETTLTSGDIPLFYNASEVFRNGWLGAVPNMALQNTIRRYLAHVQAVRMSTMRDPVSQKVIVAGQKNLLRAFQDRDGVRASELMMQFVLAAEEHYLALTVEEQE